MKIKNNKNEKEREIKAHLGLWIEQYSCYLFQRNEK